MDGSNQSQSTLKQQDTDMSEYLSALRITEAILFAAPEPMTEEALADRISVNVSISLVLDELSKHYADRGVNLKAVGGRWAFRTARDLASFLEIEVKVNRKLSRAAVETLAIIGYHQPITRGEIEEIRGVALSRGTLDVLLELEWIRPVGKRKTPGRPVTWGTSQKFLENFNLNDIKDLPGTDELKAAGLLDKRPTSSIFGEVALKMDEENTERVSDCL